MATSAVGKYAPLQNATRIRNIRAWNEHDEPLRVETHSNREWSVKGNGQLSRIAYEQNCEVTSKEITDPLTTTRRYQEHFILIGYDTFIFAEEALTAGYRVHIEAPNHWRIGWSLPFEDATNTYYASEALCLADEPLFAGANIETVRTHEHRNERLITFATRANDLDAALKAALIKAASNGTRAVASLGFRRLETPFHIFIEPLHPDEHTPLGWALEHSLSFHTTVDTTSTPDESFIERMSFHFAHHELHAWIPRRLYTDRLHPRRQMFSEGTEHLWFAEGLVQYLAFCGIAKAGVVSTNTALAMLARRFVPPYLNQFPSGRPSPSELSLELCRGNHQHWFYEIAVGGLLSLWFDQKIRNHSHGEKGLLDAALHLYNDWALHKEGMPEKTFDAMFSEAAGISLHADFENFIYGNGLLPVDEILHRAGLVKEGTNYKVLEAPNNARAASFQTQSFGHSPRV